MKTVSIALMIVGALLLLTGLFFEMMKFPPHLFRGIISGPVLLIVGLILFFVYKIIRR